VIFLVIVTMLMLMLSFFDPAHEQSRQNVIGNLGSRSSELPSPPQP
jgi:hypothetical protein